MKFNLLDKIDTPLLDSSTRIVGVKNVTLSEEYLADHFPTFPVLPGVMMLEAIVQAASWLLHVRQGFSKSIVVLKEAKNIKYGNFVAPGNSLTVEVELLKETETGATFKASGNVGVPPTQAVSARIELASFNLAEKMGSSMSETDEKLRQHNRARWNLIAPKQESFVLGH